MTTPPNSKGIQILNLVLRILSAGLLFQTLYFKFSGAPESVWIFTTLGVEPWGRIGSGVVELVTGALLLIPATQAIGAILGLGVMAGAILSHLAILGIEIQGDGGLLFGLAVTIAISCAAIAWINRASLIQLATRLLPWL